MQENEEKAFRTPVFVLSCTNNRQIFVASFYENLFLIYSESDVGLAAHLFGSPPVIQISRTLPAYVSANSKPLLPAAGVKGQGEAHLRLNHLP